MPIYQCKPGSNSPEPWRHGVPVYALPIPLDSSSTEQTLAVTGGGETTAAASNTHIYDSNTNTNNNINNATTTTNNNNNATTTTNNNTNINNSDSQTQMHQYEDDNTRYTTHTLAGAASRPVQVLRNETVTHIRRVKHAEIVLVDEVSVHYGNYWLRLRWPGTRGGVAGYIALGGVDVVPVRKVQELKDELRLSDNKLKSMRKNRSGSHSGEEGGTGDREGDTRELNEDQHLIQLSIDLRRDMVHIDQNEDSVHGFDDDDDNNDAAKDHHPVVNSSSYNSDHEPSIPEEEEEGDDVGLIDPPTSEPDDLYQIKCESTGLYFPSTPAMSLLALYDDGLSPDGIMDDVIDHMMDHNHRGGGSGDNERQAVQCRICREGLHDIDYCYEVEGEGNGSGSGSGNGGKKKTEEKMNSTSSRNNDNHASNAPVSAAENVVRQRGMSMHAAYDSNNNNNSSSNPEPNNDNDAATARAEAQQNMPFMMQNHLLNESLNHLQNEQGHSTTSASALMNQNNKPDQSQSPIKAEEINHPYAENPLLAPCECSGSMAFVHYLCIEQWRCRSHHPAAKNGLNCETCHAAYTLPPPPSRPESRPDAEEEDWLEAMPPHVLAALRHPHICWQVGAAIVRRRWLRPIAPILTSPIVALYCRGRRSLKKRGVSRRRWACSLCRRRARWKCVRCLRSYYCSRQCQNVSWHIVHKHVCYKPARFWWSVVVYGMAYLYFVPQVLSYPLIYDLGLGFLWLSFVLMGVIGGGIATIMKREMGIDIRGRTLELSVVCMTIWMALVCWGLVWAFFGEADQCIGVMDKFDSFKTSMNIPSINISLYRSTSDSFSLSGEQTLLRNLILKPAKKVISTVDQGLLKTGPWITGLICSAEDSGDASTKTCLQLTQKTNPDFMLPDYDGEKCASDFNVISAFCYFAALIHIVSTLWRRRDRGRRAARRHHHPRPHQD